MINLRWARKYTKASEPDAGSDKQNEPNFSVASCGKYLSLSALEPQLMNPVFTKVF